MKDTLAAEELPSDEDEMPELSEDPEQWSSASQSRSSTPLPSHTPEPPNTSKKQKKIHSTDAIELEKFKILQQMSTTFQNRSRPAAAADGDTTFGVQGTTELKLITDKVRETRVKRQIMTNLGIYEAQESTYHPQPSSLNTYTYSQALPHQYKTHLSQTSFQRMLESDDTGAVGATLFIFLLYIIYIYIVYFFILFHKTVY